jgi:hypothetical protein
MVSTTDKADNNNILAQLGFIKLSQVIKKNTITNIQNAVNGHNVNYTVIQNYIDGEMLDIIENNMGWDSPQWSYFRMSNNNNSTDAGSLHRDFGDFTDQKTGIKDVYTVLTYADISSVQVIPGTHKNRSININLVGLIIDYFQALTLTIQPGDLLIINSFMFHRGIFRFRTKNRRLLQVFAVFPTIKITKQLDPQFIIMNHTSYHKISGMIDKMSKTPGINEICNFFQYLINAVTVHPMFINETQYHGNILYHRGSPALKIIKGTMQADNNYVDNPKYNKREADFIYDKSTHIIAIIIVIMIVYLAHKHFKKRTSIGETVIEIQL